MRRLAQSVLVGAATALGRGGGGGDERLDRVGNLAREGGVGGEGARRESARSSGAAAAESFDPCALASACTRKARGSSAGVAFAASKSARPATYGTSGAPAAAAPPPPPPPP